MRRLVKNANANATDIHRHAFMLVELNKRLLQLKIDGKPLPDTSITDPVLRDINVKFNRKAKELTRHG